LWLSEVRSGYSGILPQPRSAISARFSARRPLPETDQLRAAVEILVALVERAGRRRLVIPGGAGRVQY
jgi:hypothetical protein